MPHGLFVGLITLDVIYRIDQIPQPNQKQVAQDHLLAAGGPATNAAVAFAALGGDASLLGSLGQHPLQQLVRSDLAPWGIRLLDLQPDRPDPPPLSTILVTAATGDRAVVSRNAVQRQATVADIPRSLQAPAPPPPDLPIVPTAGTLAEGNSPSEAPTEIDWNRDAIDLNLTSIDVVLIDGHQMTVGAAIAQAAQSAHCPVVVDAGSWKPGFDAVLAQADYVIASANFYPPGCTTIAAVVDYCARLGVPKLAITQGAAPILSWDLAAGQDCRVCPVPAIHPVDTLGAGDIFHGAFCAALCHLPRPGQGVTQSDPPRSAPDFLTALAQAADVAAYCCQWFGSRAGLQQMQAKPPISPSV